MYELRNINPSKPTGFDNHPAVLINLAASEIAYPYALLVNRSRTVFPNSEKWLSLNIGKTEFMTIGSSQKLRAIDNIITVKISELDINSVNSVKSLGVFFDDHLTWTTHIDKISKKIASAIGALRRIRPYIRTNTTVQVYQPLIQTHFDYCRSIWDGLGETLYCKLQKLQNRAARIIMRANYDSSASILFLITCTGITP